MEELYVEGLAAHGGPESCVVTRVGSGEALQGYVQAARLSDSGTSRGQRTRACAEPSCARNRESPCPPVRLITGWADQTTPRR